MKRELNISTYEEWMIDLMDGRLSPDEQARLHRFLEDQPQLAEDLDSLSDMVLIPDQEVFFSEKERLKMEELQDESIISLIESNGDLNLLQGAERELADQYLRTKLVADTRIVYPDKGSLRKKEGVVIPLWIKAASIAASLIMAFFLIPQNEPSTYMAREGRQVWEPIVPSSYDGDFADAGDPRSQTDQLDLADTTPDTPSQRPSSVGPDKVNLAHDPAPIEKRPEDIQPEPFEAPEELLTEVPVLEDTPLTESISDPASEEDLVESPDGLVESPKDGQRNLSPVSKKLQEDRPFTTALDLLKKATANSEFLAIQEVDPEAAYVQTSLKLGRFEVAVKRKRKN